MGYWNALRRGSIASAGVLAGALAAAAPAAAQTLPICGVGGAVPVLGTVTGCTPAPGGSAPGVTVPGITVPGVPVGTSTLPVVGGSTGAPGPGGGSAGTSASGRDTRAPRARLSARRGRLSLALLKGYSVVVFCDEACTVKGELAQSGRRATLGRGSARIATPGKGKVKLRFTRSARKALRRTASAKLTIRVTVTDAAGNAATRRVAVTLRR